MERRSFAHILNILIEDYSVPIGFEESILDRKNRAFDFATNLPVDKELNVLSKGETDQVLEEMERAYPPQIPITVNVKNERLETVLNLIVRQIANYEWQINDGVVNILPVKGRDETYKTFLEINIKRFELRSPFVLSIKNDLYDLPEFKVFMDEHKLSYSNSHGDSVDTLRRRLPGEIRFSDLTLKSLLNKIAKIKGGGWILKHRDFPNGKEGIDIDI